MFPKNLILSLIYDLNASSALYNLQCVGAKFTRTNCIYGYLLQLISGVPFRLKICSAWKFCPYWLCSSADTFLWLFSTSLLYTPTPVRFLQIRYNFTRLGPCYITVISGKEIDSVKNEKKRNKRTTTTNRCVSSLLCACSGSILVSLFY